MGAFRYMANLDQDRRDARAWAQEWHIKQKNMKIFRVIAVIAVIAALYFIINFVIVHATRTTYGSVEEMRAALQGRFETDYCEDMEIIGDDITLTYYEISHYDSEYAEQYGYSEYEDSVYDDKIVEWDYRHGLIKCNWMSDIKVDKDGNLRYYSETFVKTDAPKPVPIDPSTLTGGSGTWDTEGEDPEAIDEAAEAVQEEQQMTEESAEEAGVLAADASEGV